MKSRNVRKLSNTVCLNITLSLQKQQAELEKELQALQGNAEGGPPKVEISPPSPGTEAKNK